MTKFFIPALGVLAFFSASQSSMSGGSGGPASAAAISSACAAEPTMETITLTGDFAVFTGSMCPDAPLR